MLLDQSGFHCFSEHCSGEQKVCCLHFCATGQYFLSTESYLSPHLQSAIRGFGIELSSVHPTEHLPHRAIWQTVTDCFLGDLLLLAKMLQWDFGGIRFMKGKSSHSSDLSIRFDFRYSVNAVLMKSARLIALEIEDLSFSTKQLHHGHPQHDLPQTALSRC